MGIKLLLLTRRAEYQGLPVDECKIRPKSVERSSKNGRDATGLPVGFPKKEVEDREIIKFTA